jgi:hypothetical protein
MVVSIAVVLVSTISSCLTAASWLFVVITAAAAAAAFRIIFLRPIFFALKTQAGSRQDSDKVRSL